MKEIYLLVKQAENENDLDLILKAFSTKIKALEFVRNKNALAIDQKNLPKYQVLTISLD